MKGDQIDLKNKKQIEIKSSPRKSISKVKSRKRGPGPKPQSRTSRLCKYRRKTANLRERMRMGEINRAFENLRLKIPSLMTSSSTRCEKVTKINLLHLAINYIRALESILKTGEPGVQEFGTCVVCRPTNISDQELASDLIPITKTYRTPRTFLKKNGKVKKKVVSAENVKRTKLKKDSLTNLCDSLDNRTDEEFLKAPDLHPDNFNRINPEVNNKALPSEGFPEFQFEVSEILDDLETIEASLKDCYCFNDLKLFM